MTNINATQKRTIYYGFNGLIEPGSATRIASAFNAAVNEEYDEICLCLGSNGGTVADGVYLYNHIRSLPIDVIIHNASIVASIAVAVYVAAEERYCSKHSVFLIHPTSIPAEYDMKAERLRDLLDTALSLDKRTEDILRDRVIGIPDDVLGARRYRDVFITPEDALKFGLVDGINEFSLPRENKIFQI